MDIANVIRELMELYKEFPLSSINNQRIKPDIKHLLVEVNKAVVDNIASTNIETSINAVMDIAWEECNIGHWSAVPDTPKEVYSYACFLKIIVLLLKISKRPDEKTAILKEAIGAADLGLMLGIGFQRLLSRAACLMTEIHDKEQKPDVSTGQKHNESQPETANFDVSHESLFENFNCQNVERLICPSLEEFGRKHFNCRIPVLLSGCMDHWPAMSKWNNLNYFIQSAGPRIVPIEIGSSYTQKDWGMELTSINDFINNHILKKAHRVGYLAQHQLFDQIPELRKDIIIPDYCCLSDEEDTEPEVDINAWFGPANTLTPLHHDPKHNLLCQVIGAKRILLFSPSDSEYLYPHDTNMLDNTAQVDPYKPDFTKFPKFKEATVYICKLQPGEMLYIPPKWWHYVQSLDTSFSVSFWWM